MYSLEKILQYDLYV